MNQAILPCWRLGVLSVAVATVVAYVGELQAVDRDANLVAEGAKVEKLGGGYRFTEGPAVDDKGNVYFTDIPNNRIHRWDAKTRKITVFLENSGGCNGLFFKDSTTLYACQGNEKRVVAIDLKTKKVTPLAATYGGKPFNKPNDLWIDKKGGVYFTDPNYGGKPLSQDGEHVYYRAADGKVTRVADDFERPNGVIGTADGKTLYVADRNGDKTYVYKINADGTLGSKRLFCKSGSDGMTLDERGNLYITPRDSAVHVYSSAGKLVTKIATPKPPSNVCFGGADGKTLFITSRDGVYGVRMNVKGQ